MLFNGAGLDAASKRYIGMVPQDDVLLPTSSVEEAIAFSAAIRLPPHYTVAQRASMVSELISDLGLGTVRQARIGDTRRRKGISGGERKRCSIAVELAHRPKVLLLDEPTSGLDSSGAHQLLKLLHTLAASASVAVAFTIHQPSSRDFSLFDKLLVLSSGKTVYYGPRCEALSYFKALGHQCPPYTNPAEFVLDLATGFEIGATQQQLLIDRYLATPAAVQSQESVPSLNAATTQGAGSGQRGRRSSPRKAGGAGGGGVGGGAPAERDLGGMEGGHIYATSFWRQFALLFARSWRHARRCPVSSRAALSRSITMGLLVGFLYYDVDTSQVSVQDRTGALYFVLTTQIFSAQASLRVFLEERDLFLREHIAGAYSTGAYYWAKSLADTPLQLFNALLFSLLGYFLVGLQGSAYHLVTYCMTIVITTLAAESYVVFVGAAAPDDKVAAVLGPVAFALMSLLGGFFLNLESLPVWFSWLQHLSLFRYSFAAVMQNEFRGLRFSCSQDDTAKWLDTLDEATRDHVMEFVHLLPCPTPDGETHLKRLKVDALPVWHNILYLVALMAFFRLLGYYSLHQRAKRLLPAGECSVQDSVPVANEQREKDT